MNKYEAMVIVRIDLGEEDRKAVFQQVADAITKNKGTVTHAAVWAERRKFTFPIKKHQEGLYYLVNFDAPSAAIRELESTYRLNEGILRVLITALGK